MDLKEALHRLELGPRVSFTADQLASIEKIQDYRNVFEHYRVAVRNRYELWEDLTGFLRVLDAFLVDQLSIEIEETAGGKALRHKIGSVESVWSRIVERRIEEWRQEMLPVWKRFHRNRKAALSTVRAEQYDTKGAEEFFIYCPDCDRSTLICNGSFKGVCANKECKEFSPIGTCTRCGALVAGFPWEDKWCESCKDWREGWMRADD